MLRGDFHHHVDTDPVDGRFIKHSIGELIDRAATVGLNVLAVTCHEGIPYDDDAVRYAEQKGILLLRGMEATVQGRHLLLINFREFPSGVCTMEDVARHKDADSLVIVPHPFYPTMVAGGDVLEEDSSIIDAVEFSGMYTPLTKRFNLRAQDLARRSSLPVVGNSDTHFLWQPGRTYTRIDAPADTRSVVQAIRHGRVQLVTQPLTWKHALRFIYESQTGVGAIQEAAHFLNRVLRRTRRAQRSTEPIAT